MRKWLLVIAAIVLCNCREPYPNRAVDPNDPIYFYIKMPEFMAHWPRGTDVAEFRWHWYSNDESIAVSSSGGLMPRETLNPSLALNAEVKKRWIWLLTMEPNFKKTDEGRYLSLAKEKYKWEVVTADETDGHWFHVRAFVISGRGSDSYEDDGSSTPLSIERAEAILKSLESGRYVNREAYFKLMGGRPPNKQRLVVELQEDGVLQYEGKEVSLQQFIIISREAVEDNPKFRLHLRADKKCKTEDIRAVVKAAAEGGLTDVIFGALVKDR